jgi:hypothetical protein
MADGKLFDNESLVVRTWQWSDLAGKLLRVRYLPPVADGLEPAMIALVDVASGITYLTSGSPLPQIGDDNVVV